MLATGCNQSLTGTAGVKAIHLYGDLAREFGARFDIFAASPIKALTILEANFYGRFMRALSKGSYFVWLKKADGVEIGLEDPEALFFASGDAELHVMPDAEGAGRNKGGIMALLGVVITGAAFVFSGGMGAASLVAGFEAMQGTVWGTMAQMGVGMTLTGVGLFLTPLPDADLDSKEQSSAIFSGNANVMVEGGAVPVCYGAPYVASTMISAGISVENTPS